MIHFPVIESLQIFGMILRAGILGDGHGNTNVDRAIIFRSVALSARAVSIGGLFHFSICNVAGRLGPILA